jgi:hypothetical protein
MQVSMFRPSHLFGAIAAVVMGVALLSWAPWSAQARGTNAAPLRSSNVAMNCAPGQQALVRQAVVDGELSVSVDCAGPAAAPVAYRDFDQPLLQSTQPVAAVPAVYRPAPVPAYAPTVRRARASASRVEPRRDWKREALIIGGATGAAAGVGALIGGKKGALIGAALGGGGSALYRATKK